MESSSVLVNIVWASMYVHALSFSLLVLEASPPAEESTAREGGSALGGPAPGPPASTVTGLPLSVTRQDRPQPYGRPRPNPSDGRSSRPTASPSLLERLPAGRVLAFLQVPVPAEARSTSAACGAPPRLGRRDGEDPRETRARPAMLQERALTPRAAAGLLARPEGRSHPCDSGSFPSRQLRKFLRFDSERLAREPQAGML